MCLLTPKIAEMIQLDQYNWMVQPASSRVSWTLSAIYQIFGLTVDRVRQPGVYGSGGFTGLENVH